MMFLKYLWRCACFWLGGHKYTFKGRAKSLLPISMYECMWCGKRKYVSFDEESW
jgi:hypothetical protein